MIQIMQLTDEISFGPQPGEQDLGALAKAGFRAVINLRHDGEDDQPITPADEGPKVRKLGMDYANVPVRMRTCRAETVDRFRGELDRLAKPVFVHCRLGVRAGGLAIIDVAVRAGMSGEQALARARELGVDLRDDRLVTLIKEYVDARRAVRT